MSNLLINMFKYALIFSIAFLAALCFQSTCLNENQTISIWSLINTIGTFLGGVGTIAASFCAFLALSNWKEQSKGGSTLNRLVSCREKISILCCEFLDRKISVSPEEKERLHGVAQSLDSDLAILSRIINKNEKILEIKEMLFMPRVRIRDYGVLWEEEKNQLVRAEEEIKKFMKNI